MGWFRPAGTGIPAEPRLCVVSILRANDARTAGAGVLLTDRDVLTCAHVVNDALGRTPFASPQPDPDPIALVLHGNQGPVRNEASTIFWIPPRRLDGSPLPLAGDELEWAGDLAVLRLADGPPAPLPPPAWHRMAEGQSLRAWHGTGLRGSFANVRVQSCDDWIGYLDGDITGMPIGPAYSGGPLWSSADGAAVGLVTARIGAPVDESTGRPEPYHPQQVTRRGWGIPWQRIELELRHAGAGALLRDRESCGVPDAALVPEDPAQPLLADLLDILLPSSSALAKRARHVAEQCGTGHPGDGSAPSVEEFALFLVTEERALAALTEILRVRTPEAVPDLLAAGRVSPVPRLLSPREHRKLLDLLDTLPASVTARLAEATRAALPLAAALPCDTDPPEFVDRLERLSGDGRTAVSGPRVPGLLRAVEYVAAMCPPAQRARLRLWADGVASRVGIPASSLRERRDDAEDWVVLRKADSSAPRLLVRISRERQGRYSLRIWCDEGAGPRGMSLGDSPTYTAGQGIALILEVLEPLYRAAPEGVRPVVEFLVDRDSLELPLDEWQLPDPDGLVPGVLGAEYPLVIHCPELVRRSGRYLNDWRRRWKHLDTAAALHFAEPSVTAREAYGMLMDSVDAAQVTVDVPSRIRLEIVQVCLAMGVPVVLWDREAEQGSHAVRHATGAAPRTLPERVRSYRAKSLHRPSDHPGRPVLAWADADRALPPDLELADPTEAV
ncbi:trypsin-like peptidase domain-containing protein [Streptomyces sp. NPDC051219]|uniref:VMAP-C domain-containing protein n=1 Tax=Streptomyces sp. NPDC051219 TaxID=3155283 RepID=UPI0034156A7D